MSTARIFPFIIFTFAISPALFAGNNSAPVQKLDAPLLRFEENKNQFDPRVVYEADLTRSGKVFFEKNAFTYLFWNADEIEQLHHPSPVNGVISPDQDVTVHYHCFRAEFLGANSDPFISAGLPAPYYKNYFLGNDPAKWAPEVHLYDEMDYNELYPSVGVHLYSRDGNLEYDFKVDEDGDPSVIRINYAGADKVSLNDGNLVIHTSLGDVTEQRPYAYQVIDGRETAVRCRYVLHGTVASFEFPDGYDHAWPLVIDPTLVCSTFSGSTSDNWGYTATYDAQGDIYSGGIGTAIGYPTTAGAFQTTFGGGGSGGNAYPFDITLTKYNPSGTALLFSTYLGGSDNEQPQSIVVDSNDELCVIGRTYSSNFPVTAGAYDVSYNGNADIIVTKFNSTGTALVGSTFVGGSGDDGVNITANFYTWMSLKYNYGDDGRSDIITDNAGNCYIASSTQSANFPVTGGAYQSSFGGGTQDGCVFKLNSNLTSMTWSTFLGGSGDDAVYSIQLDGTNSVYVSGGTSSSNFPTTPGTLHTTFQGGTADGFISHLDPSGVAMLQSTFIGTNGYDQAYFIQLDNSSNVYVYGQTAGAYPVSAGVYSNPNSGQFIHKMNASLSSTFYSTVFGSGTGTPNISPSAFLVDTCENVYAAGWGGQCIPYGSTGTTVGLPVTSNAFQSTTDGCDFYFFVLKKNAISLWYATYFGGNLGSDEHVDGGTSRFDKRGVIYQSVCAGCGGSQNFPTTPGAWSTTNNSFNCNNAVIKMDFQLVNLSAVAVASPSDSICLGTTMSFANNSIGAQDYEWNFGDGSPADTSTAPSHQYTTPGSYTVTLIAIDSLGCNTSDTTQIYVTVLPVPVVDLGPDTTFCGTPNLTLDAGNPGAQYTWNTGATSQTINVNSAGTYWVTAGNGVCSDKDTITVSVFTPPDLGGDTTLCEGNPVTLDAGNPGSTYAWSTGAATQTISVNSSGTYSVTVTSGTCQLSDSIIVNFVAVPQVDLGPDLSLCPGQTATLNAGNPGDTYLWSNNSIEDSITVSAGGTYYVTVWNSGCSASDSVNVQAIAPFDLGPDVNLCDNAGIHLVSENLGGASYLWSTGDTTFSIEVNEAGTYWVNISTGNCMLTDTIDVIGGFGPSTVYVPNCFTPNHDGKNDIFYAEGVDIISFHMMIFDRWGEMIFESYDMGQGWDGTYKGDKVPNDVYVVVIDFTTQCSGENTVRKISHVSVYK
ncbi:MAG TPA: gliding motility-associated C-terminal domain-containing protein [Bacteroidia bacterium]|nr:gliding motility-associated C-terminal domain-containing protein [Bacteroidia bacterium]